MRALRQVAVVAVLLLSAALPGWAEDAPKLLQFPENRVQFQLYPEPVLTFVVVNSANQPLEGDVSIELIDTVAKDNRYEDAVFASSKGTFKEAPGDTVEKMPWPVKQLPSAEIASLARMRLRYSFTPKLGFNFAPVRGVIQFGRVLTNRFNVSISSAAHSVPGANYPVRVRVDDPDTGKPLADIPVEVELDMSGCSRDSDDKEIVRKLATGIDGYANTTFRVPQLTTCDDGSVHATAVRAGFTDYDSMDFKLPEGSTLRLTTDKPLYQPGQTIHMRLLALGPNRHVLEGAKVKFTVTGDSNGQTFEKGVTTSNFGIATADWQVPRTQELGDYEINAELIESPTWEGQKTNSTVRISRYELPTFTVNVKPDHPYYVVGQNAAVEVSADYLFGKPVQQAKVRLVRQDNGEWDSKKNRWTAEESAPVLGEFDSKGRYVAEIDLQPDANFQETDYARFKDVDMAAYVTDESSGRTEQRRFKLRVTAQPIHLYVVATTNMPSGDPEDVYITSAYADGTPASIQGKAAIGDDGSGPATPFHTNEFGLARIHLPKIPDEYVLVSGACYYGRPRETRTVPLKIEATDSNGLRGTHLEQLTFADEQREFVAVSSDRVLYRPGESIRTTITSSFPDAEFIVDVLNEKGQLASRVAHLHEGRDDVVIPYDSHFRGVLTLDVHSMVSGHQNLRTRSRVIYASPEELRLTVKLPNASFLPGQNVNTDIDVRNPEGYGVSSALGLVVFDQAVAERLRTEQDFGSYGYSNDDYFGYWHYGRIAGIGLHDLLVLDPKQPFSEAQQLLAEALLLTSNYDDGSTDGLNGGGSYTGVYGTQDNELMKQELQPARNLLDAYQKSRLVYPPEAEFRPLLKAGGVEFDSLRDLWDMPYRVSYTNELLYSVIRIYSNGPDKLPNTGDDILIEEFQWRYFQPVASMFNTLNNEYFERTGNYIRDYPTLRNEMKRKGINLDELRDPWGRRYQYQFAISGSSYETTVLSSGPDGTTGVCNDGAELVQGEFFIRYFQREHNAIVRALAEHYLKTGIFPRNESELTPVLAAAQLTPEKLLDPWGHPYHFRFEERSQYGDRMDFESFAVYPNHPVVRSNVTPVTQRVAYITVQSMGPDKNQYPIEITSFSRVLSEQSSKDIAPVAITSQAPVGVGSGTISGSVTDPTGAAIPNATVIAVAETLKRYETMTNASGVFTIANLPAGFYGVEVAQRVPGLTGCESASVVL